MPKPYIVKPPGGPPRTPANPPPADSPYSLPNRDAFEMDVVRRATYFTVWRRFRTPMQRTGGGHQQTFSDFADALNFAWRDPRAIVYAVAADNHCVDSAPLARNRWKEFYLEWKRIRKEAHRG